MSTLTLMARGNFSRHVGNHMEYPPENYDNFEIGDEVVTTVSKTMTESTSKILCDALGIQLKNFRTHANIDVSGVPKKMLVDSKLTPEECHSFYALRKAEFRFFVILDM
jgi:hypothetical protein